MRATKHIQFAVTCLVIMLWYPWPAFGKQNLMPASLQAEIQISTRVIHDFSDVYVGMISEVQFYDVSASHVTGSLRISADEHFLISRQCYTDFTSQIELAPANGQIATTRIYIRFAPAQTGPIQGNISHKAQQAEDQIMKLSGTGIHPKIPPAYYSTATGRGSQLKTELFQIIRNHQVVSYASLWEHFETTDATFSGQVWDIYSDIPCQEPPYEFTFVEDQDRGSGGSSEGQIFNREHTMPVSWFGGQQTIMASDMFHIYPTDKWVNALRANYPYGEVNSPNTTTRNGSKLGANTMPGYSGIAFEPIDAYKGDLARTYLYMITRYEDQLSFWNYSAEGNNMLTQNTYPAFRNWAINMLMEWHENDPVSQKEIRRNNAVFDIQGNRNPFIDHPEFVQLIWGDTTTHIAQIPDAASIAVFPNPANNMVNIATDKTIHQVDVFSTSGNLIASYNTHNNHTQICTANIPPGFYFIRIRFSDSYLTKQLIIHHSTH